MRYSLLDVLACPDTHAPFVLVGASEAAFAYLGPYGGRATRVGRPGAAVGPAPEGEAGRFYAEHLAGHATPADDPERDKHAIVVDGLLVSTETGLWFPIVETIPEILPASLRDWNGHRAFLDQVIAPRIPADLVAALHRAVDGIDAAGRQGDSYKTSEMTLLGKVEDREGFLWPGLVSPFNPYIYHHPADLIRGFANCLPFLRLQHGSRVLDSGCGYGWTTEWLMKLGIEAVGIDIARAYPDVGRQRMGPHNQPHLVIGDAEYLPFRDDAFDAVLCFDAFHHIPDRPAAMRQYARTLKADGRVVLVEPGAQHETAAVSIDVMNTYGIMEVGMELTDIQGYIAGIDAFAGARQVFLTPHYADDPRQTVPVSELRDRSFIGWGLFVVETQGAAAQRPRPAPPPEAAPAHRPRGGLHRLTRGLANLGRPKAR